MNDRHEHEEFHPLPILLRIIFCIYTSPVSLICLNLIQTHILYLLHCCFQFKVSHVCLCQTKQCMNWVTAQVLNLFIWLCCNWANFTLDLRFALFFFKKWLMKLLFCLHNPLLVWIHFCLICGLSFTVYINGDIAFTSCVNYFKLLAFQFNWKTSTKIQFSFEPERV